MRKERKAELKAAVIKQIKSLIFPVILAAIIIAGIFVIMNTKTVEEEQEIIKANGYEGDDKPLVLENDTIKFTLDPTTTHFTVEKKSTGKIWYSNVPNADDEPGVTDVEANKSQATLMVKYTTERGMEETYDNYRYSISGQIYDIESTEDKVIVHYSIGDIEREYIIPYVIREADFDKWLANLDQTNQATVKKMYEKIDINDPKKAKKVEEWLEKYPIAENEVVWALREDNRKSKQQKKKLEKRFEEAGYTYEDYTADKELDTASFSSDKPIFNVDMIYSLDGESLKVEVPLDKLEFRSDYPIYDLTVLPYMGAGGSADNGYMFVPEGGGALINFNNGKISQNLYYANVYGWDMCVSRDYLMHNTRAFYNVFGVSDGEEASFICTLEDGASYAAISADVGGKATNYFNNVNAVYRIIQKQQYDVGNLANSNIFVFQKQVPEGSIVQKYTFVDSANYVDMAKTYGDYLEKKYGADFAMNTDTSTPVAVEIVGAVDKVQQVLGVPTSRPLELTDFDEAAQMITDITNDGMKNMYVKFSGWANGGVKQQILNSVSVIGKLGGKSGLKNFMSTATGLNIPVYLNGITHYAYDSDIFDGFISYFDAAKFINRERAELFTFSDVTYAAREGLPSYYLLHADKIIEMGNNLISAAQGYGANVSFQDTGMDISSDFYNKNYVSREAAKNMQIEQLKNAKANGTGVMINMGNDYAIAYADMVTNMDLKGSEYTILDSFVPFYQIAIHGHVNYTGSAINVSGNADEEVLLAVEYGAGLQFTLMKESAFTLQKTLYTEYYGSDYDAWCNDMMAIYNRYNAELGHTFNQEMVDHEMLTSDLSCTTYADGTKAYVNYGYKDAEADGIVIPGRDYKVVR